MSTTSDMQLTTTDALSYLKTVREVFQDKRDKYDEFIDIMKDFKAQIIGTTDVIRRVKELFKGYDDLILGFNAFLPKDYEIALSPDDEEPFLRKKPVEFEEAVRFAKKIKARFQGDNNAYKAFLDILNSYRKDNKPITEVYQEHQKIRERKQILRVAALTTSAQGHEPPEPHPNRRAALATPSRSRETSELHPTPSRSTSSRPKPTPKTHSCTLEHRISTMVNEQVSVLFQNHADLLVEFTHFLPDISGAASVQYAQPSRNHVEKVDKGKGKQKARDNDEWENDDDDDDDDDGSDYRRKSAGRYGLAADQLPGGGMEGAESAFREKVKERLRAPENYEKISDCICSFKNKFVPAADFRKLVASLIGEHPDLMEACEDFITYIEKSGIKQINKQVFRSLKVDENGDDHDWEDRDETKDHDNREKDRRDRGLAFNSKAVPGQKISCTSKDKSMAKPIHELDLSEFKSCTPSYRLLPENYPIPLASRRTEIGNQVLNDRLVSVTSGSEDHSFKHMHKNQYEETLFQCEDDRFELDMLLESVNATVKHVEELLDRMNAHTTKADSSFNIEECLSALSLRCIERLYGDHGLDVVDLLRKNAPAALPVILTRLKQKQEELARCRADFNKVWAGIYAKNYPKSLDHRSFYFKQQDTKNLSAKAMLAEIKEMCEKNQNKDESLLASIAAGYKCSIKPDMVFEYPDPEIQDDLHQLMNYTCGEVCTPEQRDNVMNLWTTFLEQVMRVPLRPSTTEKKKDADKENGLLDKSTESICEENDSPAYGSPCGDNVGNKGDVLCDAPEEDLSIALKGSDCAVAACKTVPTPIQGPLEVFKKPREESEACTKTEREEGELSINRNQMEIDNLFSADNYTKEEMIAVAREEDEDSSSDSEKNVVSDESVGEADVSEGDGTEQFVNRFVGPEKPLALSVPMGLRGGVESCGVFYGNDSFYLLFRLHQILYDRMMSAKLHSSSSGNRWKISNGANQTDSYAGFKNALRSLLNGSIDNAKFEDECRAIIGAQSYVLFTLGKLIHKLVKQLQTIASDEMDNKLLQLYSYERSRNTKSFSDEVYHVNARVLLPNDNLYRIECLPCPTRLTIQLMRKEHEKFESIAVSMDHEFAAYLKNELLTVVPERTWKHGLYLKRNKKKLYNGDESFDFEKAMEGLVIHNGVKMKVNSLTKKVAYVLATEDFMYRTKGRRRVLYQ
ncbi:Paired amphipathic helix protein Sin3-like 4 [Striga hermonthica]|uniref:Paired amphipathic helix protein Sin3-like 4 n=1 Tax=Striga hermonthica TaxID=68872 RepID=A0A9N7RNR0_STRHE|nr:Paired amphipathic helix protein Sin3-like 4 [Striga hermonthica]